VPKQVLQARSAWPELDRLVERQPLAGASGERQRQRRHPRFGERGGVEAGTARRDEWLAADAVAARVAEDEALAVGDDRLGGAHGAAERRQTVEPGTQLTVGRHARILPRIVTAASRIVVAHGAWAAETALLDEVERRLPAATLPAAPVVVLVPSRSLREHLLGRLAERRAAWLGLEVTTLAGLAAAILVRSGAALPSGAALVPLLVRRLAARERPLAAALGQLADGYDAIGGAVRDLLDAGFVEAHLEAVEERLALERAAAGAGAVERAQAIARVAAGVRHELAARALAAPSDRLAAAAARLAADPESALPVAAVLVHGFADLTGLGADLLAALVRHRPTVVVLDTPPELDGSAAEWRFGRRLLERLRGIAPLERADAARTAGAQRHFTPPIRRAKRAPPSAGSPTDSPPSAARTGRSSRAKSAATSPRGHASSIGKACRSRAKRPPRRRGPGVPPDSSSCSRAAATTPLGVALAVAEERLAADSGVAVADLRLGSRCAVRARWRPRRGCRRRTPRSSCRSPTVSKRRRPKAGGCVLESSRSLRSSPRAGAWRTIHAASSTPSPRRGRLASGWSRCVAGSFAWSRTPKPSSSPRRSLRSKARSPASTSTPKSGGASSSRRGAARSPRRAARAAASLCFR
jgi:hypothetical protein